MPFSHFRIGLDYLPPRGWVDFDAVGVGRDFDITVSLGIDMVRVAMPWEFMGPAPERPSQVALGKLLAVLDLAQARGLAVVPALLGGQPAYLGGRSPWSDPVALRVQVRHLAQLGDRIRQHPAIAAWDLGAAPDRWWSEPAPDDAWLWAHAVCAHWRRTVSQPVMVTAVSPAPPWSDLRDGLDLAGVALAPGAAPAYARWPQDPLVPAFQAALAGRLAGRPAVVVAFEDAAGDTAPASFHREALEAMWRAGAAGAFASFARLQGDGALRPHSRDVAAMAGERRPLQAVPPGVDPDPERLAAEPVAALGALFHQFAV